ncbi:MAG: hypothetical protein QOG62_493 [Thermoleophilaceae bacterium]|jgi:acyl-CoA thioesterase|nr:hypothetical protein [Thermoleophilaceae bacterium]
MTELDRDTALRPLGDGRYEGAVAEGWNTPRGPLGGYVMAILLRGLIEEVGDPERQVRSLTVNFLRSPVPGPVTVKAVIERVGRSLTTTTGRLEQDGKAIAIAIATFSKPWPGSPEFFANPMPAVEPADPDGDSTQGLPPGKRPPFADRLRMQVRFGAPLFSGADSSQVGGWLGLRDPHPLDALAVALLTDAWFPAPWPRLTELTPAPTIELSVYFRCPLPLPAGPLLGRFTSREARAGFFDEDGELWAPDGTLVAQSRQLALLIPPH